MSVYLATYALAAHASGLPYAATESANKKISSRAVHWTVPSSAATVRATRKGEKSAATAPRTVVRVAWLLAAIISITAIRCALSLISGAGTIA